jgi:hypothetical protein
VTARRAGVNLREAAKLRPTYKRRNTRRTAARTKAKAKTYVRTQRRRNTSPKVALQRIRHLRLLFSGKPEKSNLTTAPA